MVGCAVVIICDLKAIAPVVCGQVGNKYRARELLDRALQSRLQRKQHEADVQRLCCM